MYSTDPVNVLTDVIAVVALSEQELIDGRIKPLSAVNWKPLSTSSTSSTIVELRTTTSYTNAFSVKGKESDKYDSLYIITNSIIFTTIRTYQIYGTSRSDFGDSAILACIHRY